VDYDGDGTLDILSGSWPGELYFFRGEGNGKFAAGQKIKDRTGKLIKPDSATTVFCGDWNGDGLNDLLIGSIEGHVYLCRNEGSARNPAFSRPEKLAVDGKTFTTGGGDSHPVAADWDNDGKLDLVVGSGDGSVKWYRNVGSASAPKLAAGGTLLTASKMAHSPEGNGNGGCGMRAKICVTDWNQDGKNDLLVGDFNVIVKSKPEMTEANKAKMRSLEQQMTAARREMQPFYEEMSRAGRPPTNRTRYAAWEKKREATRKKYQASMNKMMQLSREYQKFQPTYEYGGFVWLLTAQSGDIASAR
jgi:hypothetical protein